MFVISVAEDLPVSSKREKLESGRHSLNPK
jgi:hypothetical protein